MTKMLKLKSWLTLDEAAQQLTQMFGEAVSTADVVQLGITRRLAMSVRLLNRTYGRQLHLLGDDDPDFPPLGSGSGYYIDVASGREAAYPLDGRVYLLDRRVIRLDQDDDVFDLPLIGAELRDLKAAYERLISGPSVEPGGPVGVFVQKAGRTYAVCSPNGNWKPDAELPMAPRFHEVSPADSLPAAAVLVVRPESLTRLVDEASADERADHRLGQREETTYLNIIGGLVALMLGKTPAGHRQSVFDSQAAISSALVATYGDRYGISARTIDKKFAAAKRSLSAG